HAPAWREGLSGLSCHGAAPLLPVGAVISEAPQLGLGPAVDALLLGDGAGLGAQEEPVDPAVGAQRGWCQGDALFSCPVVLLTRAWKPGWRPAHHPCPLRKGGCREKHHLHGAGPGPAPHGQEALIKQFVSDVAWGPLDYLVVDTPPGTSDEHMAAVDALRPYGPLGALVVTTPQAVSVGDVRRELTFCRKVGLRVIGLVENMSGFVCPHCAECTHVFSRGGGEELARHTGVPFLGSVPLDPELARSLEEGRDLARGFPDSPAFPVLSSIAQRILDETPVGLR
uniref:NUBP iron-sulfur cluster assembly factor 2, cytosolic n=1 Tax=Sus scrofa TaxID=9823 RepID=A0A8D0N5U7_PIG